MILKDKRDGEYIAEIGEDSWWIVTPDEWRWFILYGTRDGFPRHFDAKGYTFVLPTEFLAVSK